MKGWKLGEVYSQGSPGRWVVCVEVRQGGGATLVEALEPREPFVMVSPSYSGTGFSPVPPSDATRAAVGVVLGHFWRRSLSRG